MKSDDPKLEKGRQEVFERAEKMNALTLAVLRSHLLTEQCMAEYLLASGKKSKWVQKQKFSRKMLWCKMLAKNEGDQKLWEVLDAANQLRNKIAHTLSSEEIAQKMKQLKESYSSWLSPEQAADLANQTDDRVAESACLTCAGFIVTIKERLPKQLERGD